MERPIVLKVALGRYGHTKALFDGTVASERVQLSFVEFNPLPGAFRAMVRGDELDVSEIALSTHLLAHHHGKAISGLPITLWGRLHHRNLICPANSSLAGPEDLKGRAVGVRSYSQTTGVWIRGILERDYGIDPDGVTWVTMEDSHVSEFEDPPNAKRNRSSKSLRELLFAGELAAIMGERSPDPDMVRPVIANADMIEKDWHKRTGIMPVNHIVAVREDLLAHNPWLRDELTSLFERARLAGHARDEAWPPYGLEENRVSMQMLVDFSQRQHLTSRSYNIDELMS